MPLPGTYWRTLRHLKLQQFTGRLAFRLARPRPQMAPAPQRRPVSGPFVLPAQRQASLVAPQRFRLLNHEGDLADLGWTGPAADKLWRYNQHYFDDLNAQGADGRRDWHRALIEAWIAHNLPGQGDGWEPYPLSLRIVNWLKASASGFALPPAAWHSLAVQARWLVQRLEWHLLGNHLFANAKALVAAGLAFEGPEAARWLQQGLKILAEQLPEQVLPDGGQFERSPMYHALALEDLLDLINLGRTAGGGVLHPLLQPLGLEPIAARMLHWLRCMSHPDGGLSFFNDGAHGIAPPNAELACYAAQLGVQAAQPAEAGVAWLKDSGYVRLSAGGAVVLLDVAPIGPDYIPGHAHADTLSFEWSLHGHRVVVNVGTSCYGLSEQRLRERGTALHSTVQLGQLDSSEVWSGFRVGRRARPLDVQVQPAAGPADGGPLRVQASHDGYAHLPGRPIHTRCWQLQGGGLPSLEVEDRVSGPAADAVARYHLAPGLSAVPVAGPGPGGSAWQVQDAQGQRVATVTVSHGQGQVAPSVHAPEFGVLLPTQALEVRLHNGLARTVWSW